jgi:hypothetical protein
MQNVQIRLASRPSGEPTLDNFELVESEILVPQPGQMLLRAIYLSLDPYMRGRMNAGKSYARPVEIGEVMGLPTLASEPRAPGVADRVLPSLIRPFPRAQRCASCQLTHSSLLVDRTLMTPRRTNCHRVIMEGG